MELPTHPDTDDRPADRHRQPPASAWATRLVIALVVAVFVAMIVLHLTGVVGPAGQ